MDMMGLTVCMRVVCHQLFPLWNLHLQVFPSFSVVLMLNCALIQTFCCQHCFHHTWFHMVVDCHGCSGSCWSVFPSCWPQSPVTMIQTMTCRRSLCLSQRTVCCWHMLRVWCRLTGHITNHCLLSVLPYPTCSPK